MALFTRSSRCIVLAVTMTLGLSFNLLEVQAQSMSFSLGSKLENAFRPPSGPGAPAPDNTASGGTRGPCMKTDKQLIALVPPYGGKTAAEYPTIFWYIPPMSVEAQAPMVEFVLKDANNHEIYSAKYHLAKSEKGIVGTPGIMSLTVDHLYPLKIGQEYHWQLTLRCDANESDQSQNQFVEGRLQRVEPNPNLERLLQQATPQERIALYADEQLWYETLATLIQQRRDRPYDVTLADAWNKLLSSVEQGDIVAKEPLFNGARSINN